MTKSLQQTTADPCADCLRFLVVSGLQFFALPWVCVSLCGCNSLTASGPRLAQRSPDKPLVQPNQTDQRPVSNVVAASHTTPIAYQCQGTNCQELCGQSSGDTACSCGHSPSNCAVCGRQFDENEYVTDGGDIDPAVVVRKDWSATGANPTDTVVYYQTEGGKLCVQPSNRVGIYAPRFGTLRQVTGPGTAEVALSTSRVHSPVTAIGLQDQQLAANVRLNQNPVGQKQILQLDRFQEEQRGTPVDGVQPAVPVSDAVAALINVDVSVADKAVSRDLAVTASRTTLVQTMFSPESLAVIIDEKLAATVYRTQAANEVFVYETPDKCGLRVTKSTSHTTADSGDRIRFTIRFENISPNRLEKMVVMDSLSPRLEYVEASQQCSLAADFKVEPNEAGSSTLRWEIESGIERHQGGVISFDCLVR